MRKLIISGLLAGMILGVSAPAYAGHGHHLMKDGQELVHDVAHGQTSQVGTNGCHAFHEKVHKGRMNDLGKGISPAGPAQVTLVADAFSAC
ncbi:MAG: hypothetical protein HKN03_12430 [Acidimicrobiales bacterium]|nr:hypothetical protein [Acidimicrobiales bacterium]